MQLRCSEVVLYKAVCRRISAHRALESTSAYAVVTKCDSANSVNSEIVMGIGDLTDV